MILALIDGDKIIQIREAETEEQVTAYMRKWPVVVHIEDMSPMPTVGWLYRDGLLVDPLARPQSRKITKLGLRQRLTFPELIALTTAAQTSVPLQVLMANFQVATYIDLSRADTIGGMNMLVSMGLLTPERAYEILNNPIAEEERYKGE